MADMNLSDKLYNKLPSVYRAEDERVKGNYPLPLKRFLQVMGVGMSFMEGKIDGLSNLYDIDNCPIEFLSNIVQTLGFKFPYALTEREQRRFVKMLPYLYKTKGSTRSFEYLAREIFGTSSSTKAYKEHFIQGMTPLEWRRLYVEITTDGEQLDLGRKEDYFRRFAELVRPVNTILVVLLAIYYNDTYNLFEHIIEDESILNVWDTHKNENYRHNLFVNGEDSRIGKHHLILSDDLDYAFINNFSHTYSNQKIEMRDIIKEIWLPDTISQSYTEQFNKRKMSDLLLPFAINRTYIGNENFGIGYYRDYIEKIFDTSYDDLTVIVRDVYNKDLVRVGGEDLDSYRKRSFVDGVDVLDLNHVLLTGNRENFYKLNHDKTYGKQNVKNIDVITEEFLVDVIKPDLVTELVNREKYCDSLSPFTLGHSCLNNGTCGCESFLNEATVQEVHTDKSDLKAEDETLVMCLKDEIPLTDDYRNDITVNSASIHDTENTFMLRQDKEQFFILNKAKTFGGQIVKAIKRLKDDFSQDLSVEVPFAESVPLVAKDTDYNFTMNHSALNNKTWNLKDDLLVVEDMKIGAEDDTMSRNWNDEIVSSSVQEYKSLESYKSNILLDGKNIYDGINNSVITSNAFSMKLNSTARTLGSQFVSIKTIKDEPYVDTVKNTPDELLSNVHPKDSDYPFTINHASTNNMTTLLKFEKGLADNINPTDSDTTTNKLVDEDVSEIYLDSFSDKYTTDKEDNSVSTKAIYTRRSSCLGDTLSMLGAHFFTNDAQVISSLSY